MTAIVKMAAAAGLAAFLLAAQTAAQQELCPPADGRGIVANGASLQAPASIEEEATLLERVRSSSGDERSNAILSLALGGSLEAFEYLLGRRDADGLFLFGSQYLNDDGTLCLDAEIEAALLEHLHDAQLRRSLLALLGKNRYRSRELFDGLRRLVASPEEPADLRALVMALTATNLSVEEEMLAQAGSLLPHETPVQKGLMPDVHRRFVAYFGRRADPTAIPYLRDLLRVEGYSETSDYFRSKYSETRSLVYRTLDTFPSELVGEVFLNQLELLVGARRDVLTPYELAAFGERAVRHAASADQKERLSEGLDRLLEPEASDASIAYKIHDRVLELQTSIATPNAAGRILAELERQVGGDDGSARALTAKAMHALAGLPVEVELDVPRFVSSASKLPVRERLLLAPEVLDQHPHPAGHAFYLSLLDRIAEASAETEPSFRERYGIEVDSALEIVVRGLLGFDDPELLAQTRDRLDAMYAAQRVESPLYVSLSERLNRRLGDESDLFRDLVQGQERAERGRPADEKQAEWKREQQETFAAHVSAQGIQRHVQALITSHSREDAIWLLIAGRFILPAAHGALRDPAIGLEAKVRLMDVVSGVGHPSSAEPIIAVARAAGEPALMKDVFLALGQLPPTQAAADFAAEQLEDGHSPIAQRSALIYFAAHRDRSALSWARRYSAPGTDPDLRAAALYLAARQGDERALSSIVEMLEGDRDRSREEVLLRALAELSAPDRFRALVPLSSGRRESAAYATALKLSEFGAATGVDKTTLAVELIETGERWDSREAARYLLEHGQLDALEDMLNVYPAAYPLQAVIMSSSVAQIILVEARRLGFEIEETPGGFRLVED